MDKFKKKKKKKQTNKQTKTKKTYLTSETEIDNSNEW